MLQQHFEILHFFVISELLRLIEFKLERTLNGSLICLDELPNTFAVFAATIK